jgi:hypothetical protein
MGRELAAGLREFIHFRRDAGVTRIRLKFANEQAHDPPVQGEAHSGILRGPTHQFLRRCLHGLGKAIHDAVETGPETGGPQGKGHGLPPHAPKDKGPRTPQGVADLGDGEDG